MKLTPEQATKMREANLGNLVKKLKSGKTLTAAESKLIAEFEKPSETATKKQQEIAENMKAATALWGIPAAVLKAAKAAGCPAFKQQRVHREPLIAWILANPEINAATDEGADTAELRRQKVAMEVALLRNRFHRENEAVMPREEVKTKVAEMCAIFHEEAKSLMETDHYRVFVERVRARFAEKGVEE